ncbi:MAG: single-stranded DNA-binding protein [Candidatus Azambacteria bacterium]|nr:single-stranded DNA-binding protein [Candidatus Azambacteria bacterium]
MNLNKVFILGNLTRDPELRQTPSGQNVATFSIATNRAWTDKSGVKQTQVEFHNIVVWGRLAEIAHQYLAKGRLALVEGRMSTRTWQDPTGQKKSRTEIVAETMQLGPRPAVPVPGVAPALSSKSPEPAPLPEVQLEEFNEAPAANEEIKVENIPF